MERKGFVLLGIILVFVLGMSLFSGSMAFGIKQVAEPIEQFYLGQYYFEGEGPYSLSRAHRAYEAALQSDPFVSPLAWYQAGRIDFIEGRFDSALYKFGRQIEFFGDQIPGVHYMVGLTYGYRARITQSEYDWNKAAEGFKAFLALKPESPWARTDLAWIYFAQGKYEEMKPVIEKGLESEPDHPWLLNMYGLALLNTGEREIAKEYFATAQEGAEKLTAEDWGEAYPGNDPELWQRGLEEMRQAIIHNIEAAEEDPF